MGKAKITNFAQVLRLVNLLNEDERATLRDVLRPERVVAKKVKTPLKQKVAICGVCGNEESHHDHTPGYLSSHPFVPPKSAQSAGRASKRSKTPVEPPVSTETSTDDVQSAAAGSGD